MARSVSPCFRYRIANGRNSLLPGSISRRRRYTSIKAWSSRTGFLSMDAVYSIWELVIQEILHENPFDILERQGPLGLERFHCGCRNLSFHFLDLLGRFLKQNGALRIQEYLFDGLPDCRNLLLKASLGFGGVLGTDSETEEEAENADLSRCGNREGNSGKVGGGSRVVLTSSSQQSSVWIQTIRARVPFGCGSRGRRGMGSGLEKHPPQEKDGETRYCQCDSHAQKERLSFVQDGLCDLGLYNIRGFWYFNICFVDFRASGRQNKFPLEKLGNSHSGFFFGLHSTENIAGLFELRLQLQGLAKLRAGLVLFSRFQIGSTQVVIEDLIFGIDRERLEILADCILEP